MASLINKKSLQNLAELSRLELQEREAEKILKDLQNILDYFNELQGLDTSEVSAEIIPEEARKIFREDAERENTNFGLGKKSFPKSENGFLSIPPVFK
ncbi:MAG: Asp-tRNA(Asn)/Glu-tRNA(Gln) amidotransferase subunit GatC [Candidatus Liptonbacteria bacterium]|nr:Asp-tRNA(Asn)/Glu-tRNA(Gln) amidotransferase subunit GatC [Candidatus Liptonbacteria bacterium]